MVQSIEGQVDAWMVSAVRDWLIILISVIHFFWSLIALVMVIRGRDLRFNRMWPARALLALVGFLWPISFTLTTALLQNRLIIWSNGTMTHDECCKLFVVSTHGVLEPLFCLLLVLLVKFQTPSCSLAWCGIGDEALAAGLAPECSCIPAPAAQVRRKWLQGTMSALGVIVAAITCLIPSVIYYMLWFTIYDMDPSIQDSAVRWGQIGPCNQPLWSLLGSTVYVVLGVILLNVYARRLQRMAMNKLMLSRLKWTRTMSTSLLLVQMLLCWAGVIWKGMGDLTLTIVFVLDYASISLLVVSMVWFLSLRPVLQDYRPQPVQEAAIRLWTEQQIKARRKAEAAAVYFGVNKPNQGSEGQLDVSVEGSGRHDVNCHSKGMTKIVRSASGGAGSRARTSVDSMGNRPVSGSGSAPLVSSMRSMSSTSFSGAKAMTSKFSIVSEGFEGSGPVDGGQDVPRGHVNGANEGLRTKSWYQSSSRPNSKQDGKQPSETPPPQGTAESVEPHSKENPVSNSETVEMSGK